MSRMPRAGDVVYVLETLQQEKLIARTVFEVRTKNGRTWVKLSKSPDYYESPIDIDQIIPTELEAMQIIAKIQEQRLEGELMGNMILHERIRAMKSSDLARTGTGE